jgi:hypothetical protein
MRNVLLGLGISLDGYIPLVPVLIGEGIPLFPAGFPLQGNR